MDLPDKQEVQFHWSPWMDIQGDGETRFLELCGMAEAEGFASIRVPGCDESTVRLAERAAANTRRIGLRLKYMPELSGSASLGLRLIVHASESDAGEDLCTLSGLTRIDMEGDSSEAAFFAIKHANCLFRRPDRAAQVRADAMPVRHFGKQVGISTYLLARDTQNAAFAAAERMLDGDASNWVTPRIWHGALPGRAACGMLVDSYEGLAEAISQYRESGITQFLLNASGDLRELKEFASILRRSIAVA